MKLKKLFNLDYERNYSLITYIFLFFTFSFIGWIWEVILHIFYDGTFINRGALHGPWLPIYGFGGVAILLILKKFRKNPIKIFIYSMIMCGVIEYITGWYFENYKHVKYRDYSDYILNIQGRVSLWGLLLFGVGALAGVYIIAPLLDNLYSKISKTFKKILAIILIIIFSIDLVYSTFVSPNSGEGITKKISTQY